MLAGHLHLAARDSQLGIRRPARTLRCLANKRRAQPTQQPLQPAIWPNSLTTGHRGRSHTTGGLIVLEPLGSERLMRRALISKLIQSDETRRDELSVSSDPLYLPTRHTTAFIASTDRRFQVARLCADDSIARSGCFDRPKVAHNCGLGHLLFRADHSSAWLHLQVCWHATTLAPTSSLDDKGELNNNKCFWLTLTSI
jgi:hypothetical protein